LNLQVRNFIEETEYFKGGPTNPINAQEGNIEEIALNLQENELDQDQID